MPGRKRTVRDGLHRYLNQSGEQHGDQKRRATKFIGSKNTYILN